MHKANKTGSLKELQAISEHSTMVERYAIQNAAEVAFFQK